ncbi:glycine oxidase ThiO [Sporolactobacillus sp. THM7-7]|nr:glycine oxidase ThiO [Sporolactobacillus sp. THM7-7]
MAVQSSYDVIIVGGGVIGCSIAYHLAKMKKKVVVLEKDRIGSKASSAAAGMLGVQAELEEDGPMFRLGRASRDLYPALAEELRFLTGVDIALIRSGAMKPAYTKEDMEKYERIARWQKAIGETAEVLDGKAARRVEPALSEKAIGTLYFPEEGQVSPPSLVWAFSQGAARYGTEIREFTSVTDMVCKNGRFDHVETDSGAVYGDSVVVAAGAWSKRFFNKKYGADIYPVKGEVLSATTAAPLLKTTIFADGYYVTPKKGGILYIGATMAPHDYSRTVSIDGLHFLFEKAKRFVPSVTKASIKHIWAGQRPMTNDGLPFLGMDPECDGLYYATGHYRNGILLGPITGLAMAELITGRHGDEALLKPFSLDRLARIKEVKS